ncbi:hypothetical protein LX73_2475 [Fodinibius salinus]|uniref:Uncharacterized protein n=2 Tax=Fodinibius salinus TaxID=860790 RepID=A0A5D3YGK5_9BACT|nr:hypothetical protein LX73_2475 [Fodinibius salinus]
MQWLAYLGILLALAYVYLSFESYQENGWEFETIVNLICVIAWLVISYTNINNATSVEEIKLFENGITFTENKKEESIFWDEIKSINMTNNALFLTLDSKKQKELYIGYLEYKQLQEAKQKLRLFSDEHQITFSSKY